MFSFNFFKKTTAVLAVLVFSFGAGFFIGDKLNPISDKAASILGFFNFENKKSKPNQENEQLTFSSKETKTSLVAAVIDGDTIKVETGDYVRYIGIDAPESVHPNEPIKCFAKEATEKNQALVGGKVVRLEKDITDKDKYGRLLRYVYIDNIFVNAELVKNGFAIAKEYPPDLKYVNQLKNLEKNAIKEKRGLWGTCGYSEENRPEPE